MYGINQPMGPQIPSMYLPHYEVIKVNGEAGAKNFKIGPNSSALLLDETAPIVWYVQTDGTGYLTATPFDITPHQVQPPVNLDDLSARVSKLQEAIANVQQSNFGTTKQKQKRQQPASESIVDTAS